MKGNYKRTPKPAHVLNSGVACWFMNDLSIVSPGCSKGTLCNTCAECCLYFEHDERF